MTTARQIITGALTFHLNRLAIGETLNADTAAVCLDGLNHVVDEFDGARAYLFREILTAGTVTGSTGTLGVTWASILPGDQILGATYNVGAGDFPIDEMTLAQYQEGVTVKATGGTPLYWAFDGLATVYFYPAPTAIPITLRTKQPISDFASLDVDYTMPKGYKAAFSALLAEKLAPALNGAIPPAVAKAAAAARMRLGAQNADPQIIGVRPSRGNILTGWY